MQQFENSQHRLTIVALEKRINSLQGNHQDGFTQVRKSRNKSNSHQSEDIQKEALFSLVSDLEERIKVLEQNIVQLAAERDRYKKESFEVKAAFRRRSQQIHG